MPTNQKIYWFSLPAGNSVSLKIWVVWVFYILIALMWQCWQKKSKGWCVIWSHFVCGRVLRVKYYSDGRQINGSKMNSGLSFTWQSILADIQAFNRGSIWRVENRTQIDIWDDKWIPDYPTTRIITPKKSLATTKKNLVVGKKVSDLPNNRLVGRRPLAWSHCQRTNWRIL